MEEDNFAVMQAIRHYMDEYMPRIIREHLLPAFEPKALPADASAEPLNRLKLLSLDAYGPEQSPEEKRSEQIVSLLHKHGINLRHLNLVRKLVPASDPRFTELRSDLLREMVFRSMKSLARERLRSTENLDAHWLGQGPATAIDDVHPDAFEQRREGILGVAYAFTSTDVIARIAQKFEGVDLEAADILVVEQMCSKRPNDQGISFFEEHVMNRVDGIVTEAVIAPEFPTAEQAEQRMLEELQLREHTVGPFSPVLLPGMFALLELHDKAMQRGSVDAQASAADIVKRMMAIAESDSDPKRIARVLNGAGLFHLNTDQYNEALALYLRALPLQEQLFGADHLEVSVVCGNIASALWNLGRPDEAMSYHDRELAIKLKHMDPKHPALAITYGNLATVLSDQNRLSEALEYHQKELEIEQRFLPSDHLDLAVTYCNMATVYAAQQAFAQALDYHQKSFAIRVKTLGAGHVDVGASYEHIGNTLRSLDRAVDACAAFEHALKIYTANLGSQDEDSVRVKKKLMHLRTVAGTAVC